MESCGRFPVISPLLYRFSVRGIARRVRTGDVSAVRKLAAVFCTANDPGTRHIASEALMRLQNPEQAAILCRECLLWDNDELIALATRCGFEPADPADRALWLFCTSRNREPVRPGPGGLLPLLAAGYTSADGPVRLRIREAARRNGTAGLLARALAGPDVTRNAPRWSYGEWEIVLAGLTEEKRWGDLWLLVPLAPLSLGMEAVRALRTAGWAPPGDDRLLWEDLAETVPDRWLHPAPSAEHRQPAGRPAGQVTRLCFSMDGSLLATGSCDGMLSVWRTASAGPAMEFAAGPGSVRFLGIPEDNTCLVSTSDDGTVRCHGFSGRTPVWTWNGEGSGTATALSHDGTSIFAGDADGRLTILDIRAGRPLYTLRLHPSPLTCIAPAPSGQIAACGHADGTLSVVRPVNGTSPQTLPGNGSPVLHLSFDPGERSCLAVYEHGHPARWDVVTGEKECTYTGLSGRALCSAVPREGRWFAVGSDRHAIVCWEAEKTVPEVSIPLYSRHVTSCSAAADGSILAAGFHDGSVRIWRMPDGKLVREFRGHKKTVTTCTLAQGSARLATVSWDGTTKLWRVPGAEIVRTFDAHAGGIAVLAGPAGNLVAAVTEDGTARLIDGSDGTLVRVLDLYTPSVRAAAMSPDGTFLVITGADSSIRCWDIRNGSLAAAGERAGTSLRCCTFVPGGGLLVTGGWDGACRFFRVPEMTPGRAFTGHTSTVTCCTVSRDGSLLATGSNDTTVRLWRMESGEPCGVLRHSRSEVGALAFSPDGTLIAAGSSDRVIRLCRLPYGTTVQDLPGLPGRVTALTFSGDGCTLAAGYDTGTCAFFSLVDNTLIRTVPAHAGAVTGLAVLADGKTLVSSGGDGLCRFHALPVIPFPLHARPAAAGTAPAGEEPGCGKAKYHNALLAARFQGEIGICAPTDTAGCYDIQIAG
ncbi:MULTISPECIES: WD40 repeat domain-containing protein [unclassified Methanoregula]|uniref:WD40 repeat domain-containing protein n=1 Tax=unclassified Methanoregula TaxID=2649730 RepID=UPI0025F21571|nr:MULTISPECIES: hypothetical protein [unclassified Methanoregula]